MTISQGLSLPCDGRFGATLVAALVTHGYGQCAGGGWRLGDKDASPPHYARCRGLRRRFGFWIWPGPRRAAASTERPFHSAPASRTRRLLRVRIPPLRRLLSLSPQLLASLLLPAVQLRLS